MQNVSAITSPVEQDVVQFAGTEVSGHSEPQLLDEALLEFVGGAGAVSAPGHGW